MSVIFAPFQWNKIIFIFNLMLHYKKLFQQKLRLQIRSRHTPEYGQKNSVNM